MARYSYRTDIRPVQEPRTKSYIHASSHYASLSRLGSAVRRERRRTEKERPATRMIRARERTSGERRRALSLRLVLLSYGVESSCVPDSRRYDGLRGEGARRGGGGKAECETVFYSRRCRRGAYRRKEKRGRTVREALLFG